MRESVSRMCLKSTVCSKTRPLHPSVPALEQVCREIFFLLNLRDIELKHYSSSLLSNRSTKKHVYARVSLGREEIWG